MSPNKTMFYIVAILFLSEDEQSLCNATIVSSAFFYHSQEYVEKNKKQGIVKW
jgi:hypothetical protein